jgi:hypothetical protein
MGEPGYPFAVGLAVLFGFAIYAVKAMPRPLAWLGMAAGFILMGLDVTQLKAYAWPTIVAFAGIGLVIYAVLWGYRLFNAPAADDAKITLQCKREMLPKTFGPNEIVRVLNLFPTPKENGGGGVGEISNHSGKEWQWKITADDNPFGGIVGKCEITNYGTAPILDFSMFLDLTFYEAVPVPNQPNSTSMGNIRLKRPWIITAQKIDVGPENSFIFYIYNSTFDVVANVILPKTAELRWLGGGAKVRQVKLDVPNFGGEIPLDFWPLQRHANATSQQ